jgi:hypothetical protein
MQKALHIGTYTAQTEIQIINTVQLQTIQSIEELDILKNYSKERKKKTMMKNN